MTDEFPSNSQRSRRPRPEAKPVAKKQVARITTAPVKQVKKSRFKRFKEVFMGDDDQSLTDFLIFDIALPAGRDTFFDLITQGAQRKLYGNSSPRGLRRGGGWSTGVSNLASHTSYGSMGKERPSLSRRARATHNFDEIVIPTMVEANEVLNELYRLIQQFECASIRDLYEMVDLPANFTDEKYGWTDLGNASVSRVRDGYLLNLPRPEPID